ncbi:MAG: hypothetical protein M3N13_04665 [Candidatus Eremiobacteraeota bacterium]|nr:hypothetical protein [Candidatus Eremiobacteraeota bacterium]
MKPRFAGPTSSQKLERGPVGRLDIVDLALGMDEMGSDLSEAVDSVHMLAERGRPLGSVGFFVPPEMR